MASWKQKLKYNMAKSIGDFGQAIFVTKKMASVKTSTDFNQQGPLISSLCAQDCLFSTCIGQGKWIIEFQLASLYNSIPGNKKAQW